MNLRQRLEERFDPSDVDGANQAAHQALALMERCARVLAAERNGLRIGRDLANDLGASMTRLGVTLGLLDYHPTGAHADAFFFALEGKPARPEETT